MKYESPITCHSKDMVNVKVFADRQTDQKLYAPDLSIRGHKKENRKSNVRQHRPLTKEKVGSDAMEE
jgi:hypothetical protein